MSNYLSDEKKEEILKRTNDVLVSHNCAGVCSCDTCRFAAAISSLIEENAELKAARSTAIQDRDAAILDRISAEAELDKLRLAFAKLKEGQYALDARTHIHTCVRLEDIIAIEAALKNGAGEI